MTPDRILLTPEQAMSMLSDEQDIHTFRDAGMCLIGCDHSRESLLELINLHTCEIGGPACQQMNHGLVITDDNGPLFVECREGIDYAAFKKQPAHGGHLMTPFTQAELEAMGSLKKGAPFIIRNVTATQFSIARHYGGINYAGHFYAYFAATDELVRDDCLKLVAKLRKKKPVAKQETQGTLPMNAGDK